ncbi:hypothetical protein V2J09_007651 [Rumex salicifolius]
MLPSGPSNPMGGAQPVPPSLLRSSSGRLNGQGGPMQSQGAFSSLMPPRPHYNNVNVLGNVPNAQSFLNQSYGNGVLDPGFQGPNGQRGGMDTGGAESDPLSGGGMGYNPSSSSSFVSTNMVNAVSSSQVQGQQLSDQPDNQMLTDQQPSEPRNFQQPMQNFSAPSSNQSQQQYRSTRGGLGSIATVKLEAQVNSDQHGLQQQSMRGLGQVKLESQLQPMRSQPPHLKMEPQHSEQSVYLQQQHLLQMSRQSSQAAAAAQINMLQQHRLIQLQQQQQQQHQLLKSVAQQRPQMQQQFQGQNLPLRSPVKSVHEVGACARRVTQYIYQQQNRPEDNNIEFWKKYVAEFFAPNSVKKWCVSMYGSGRQTTGDVWHCEICNRKPGRGFEATFEVLPRLFKIKFDSGTLEELLYVDMPREYHNPSGQIVLDYAKAIQESVFEQLRVVRDGRLRIIFSPDLKICSWEFCARHHEELIPRRLLIPQVSQLGAAAQKYQADTQNTSSKASVSDLQGNCNMFLASAKLLAKALEVPSVNDLGYSKRYVRCLQISEVVNSMKDLIDYSRVTGTGPIESLAKYPRRNAPSSLQTQTQSSGDQQQLQQQSMLQNSIGEQPSTSQAAGVQLATINGNAPSTSSPAATVTGPQNPTSSRPQNPINSATSPYSTSSLPSPVSTGTMQPPPFRSPTPPPSNNSPLQQQPPSNNGLSNTNTHINTTNSPVNTSIQQQSAHTSNGEPTDSQSSVQKFIHEMMLNSQLNGPGGMSSDMKNANGSNGNPGLRFNGMGQAGMLNGVRAAMGGNQIPMNGRVGMGSIGRDQNMSNHQQQDLSNQLNGFGSVNDYCFPDNLNI